MDEEVERIHISTTGLLFVLTLRGVETVSRAGKLSYSTRWLAK